MLIYVRVFLHHLSCMMDMPLFRTGAPRGLPYQLLAVSSQQLASAVLRTMPHGPVMYIAIYSRRAAQGSLYRGADRQRRSERLKISPYTQGRWPFFFAYCRIVATDIHLIARMRYRRGRPKGVPLWEFRKMLCRENAICRPQSGRFLRAEGYSKRCCQFEFVAAERRILTPKKSRGS